MLKHYLSSLLGFPSIQCYEEFLIIATPALSQNSNNSITATHRLNIFSSVLRFALSSRTTAKLTHVPNSTLAYLMVDVGANLLELFPHFVYFLSFDQCIEDSARIDDEQFKYCLFYFIDIDGSVVNTRSSAKVAQARLLYNQHHHESGWIFLS